MLQRMLARRRAQTVMGHRLEEPHLTRTAVLWGFVILGLPVLALGMLLDLLIQWATGHCVGLWCYF